MSKLALASGDDHPEAAAKHLADAASLLAAARPDGAAYLSGYVVECSLKSIYQLQTGSPAPHVHGLPTLHGHVTAVATVAGSKTAKYFSAITQAVLVSPIASWRPGSRYHAASMNIADAQAWHAVAAQVFGETIAQMRLDGEL